MTLLQRLLLLPLLSPLLALLLLGAVNPRPWVALRLLTWVSPAWPLGIWISAAAAAGAGLSAAGTALALQGHGDTTAPRRQVRQRNPERERWSEPEPEVEPWAEPWAGPPRAAGEPAPTVSVPFRVIQRGRAAAPATAAAASGDDDWNRNDGDDW